MNSFPTNSQLPDIIVAPRTDPIYNCHAYLTKVPVGAIKPFISTFSKEGDTVADIFAGSGMTGLAALSEGRKAKLSDISVLGQHIAQGYLSSVDREELLEAGEVAVNQARSALGDLYLTSRATDGEEQEMIRAVWSFTYLCPCCEEKLVYIRHLDSSGKAPTNCPSCSEPFVKRSWPRGEDVPVSVVVKGENKKQLEQEISPGDLQRIRQAKQDPRQKQIPSCTIDSSREMYGRSGLGKAGMTETAAFFSPRNAIALLELWKAINSNENQAVKKKLQFAFTAILARASKRYQWSPKRPLNAQNQTYYIAPVYYEWNVFDLYKRKIQASIKADSFLFGENDLFKSKSTDVEYHLASADDLSHLKNSSIDYIFTDPPFGSNIFYSDMNLFHESWLGTTTDHDREAVVHTSGKKKNGSESRYQELLDSAFKEAYRVLKPGSYMSVVFGNSSGKIWGLVQRALRESGFDSTPSHVAILDKGQRSVKGLNSGSESVVTVDLVMTVRKPEKNTKREIGRNPENGDTKALIDETIADLDPSVLANPSHVYASILRKAIQKNLVLDELHLSDVLISLRNSGYHIDKKTGRLLSSY